MDLTFVVLILIVLAAAYFFLKNTGATTGAAAPSGKLASSTDASPKTSEATPLNAAPKSPSSPATPDRRRARKEE